MPIPESTRVVYAKNPLVEVICQLRFPSILAIGAQPPVEFQEQIRERFPHYQERRLDIELPTDIPPQVLRVLRAALPPPVGTAHEFSADATPLTIVLANNFLALTCRDYERWEDFREALMLAIRALVDVYRPHSFTRVGLRYRDIIQRSKLNLAHEPWSKLLEHHVLGELGAEEIRSDVDGVRRELLLSLPNGIGKVLVRHGTEFISPDGEECYSIDSDFFREERTEIEDADANLEQFHRDAGHLFRWFVSQQLHDALEPQELSTGI